MLRNVAEWVCAENRYGGEIYLAHTREADWVWMRVANTPAHQHPSVSIALCYWGVAFSSLVMPDFDIHFYICK